MNCPILLVVALCIGSCWGGRLAKHRFNSSAHASHALKRTMATAKPSYFGCFEGSRLSFQTTRINVNNDNNICQQFCSSNGHMFSATHKDLCGCFSKHPVIEVSGPSHGTDTIQITNGGKKCSVACPGKAGNGQCVEQNCCGGETTYTVYQVGGIIKNRCSPALSNMLEKTGVDLEKSHLPSNCQGSASRKTMEYNDDTPYIDPDTMEEDDDCDVDYTTLAKPWACCSPNCDWLLKYLCIDGSVMKCLDK